MGLGRMLKLNGEFKNKLHFWVEFYRVLVLKLAVNSKSKRNPCHSTNRPTYDNKGVSVQSDRVFIITLNPKP